jgi:acetyltransferase EpsM
MSRLPLDTEKPRRKLVIWGAGGHAVVVADLVRVSRQYEIVGFLDDVNPERHGTPFAGATVLGGREILDTLRGDGVTHLLVAFGECTPRLRCASVAEKESFELATIVHPRATVAAGVSLGAGTVVMAGAVLNPECRIGKAVIVNTSATVDHHGIVEDGVHLCPGVHLAGKVSVGRETQVGIGTCVADEVRIGARCVIGAGSVVVHDIPDDVVAFGSPAVVKNRR